MITSRDLEPIRIFACLDENGRQQLAQRAGDVSLVAGDFLNREGEPAFFHVLLEGQLSLHKNFNGRYYELTSYGKYYPGDFMGEIPLLLGARTFAVLKADRACRVARFDAQVFHRLIRDYTECRDAIMSALTERLSRLASFFAHANPTRVLIVGSSYDRSCRDIRQFLTMSRISYEWIDSEHDPDRVPADLPRLLPECAVLVDEREWVSQHPTVRSVAQALGIGTQPTKADYDVVIVGGGPAGLAACLYGASEGLRVLLVERNAVGGQAGTSTNIENYLGFPDGVSGDDLGERALRQAGRFGAEIIVTREVTQIQLLKDGAYRCWLDGGDKFEAATVILATGVVWRSLEAVGIDRLLGRGVLYGAAKTEVHTVIGKDVFIVGGGNSAGQAAVFFATYAHSVTILVRSAGLERTMSRYLIDQIAHKTNIVVEPHVRVVAAEGTDQLESITTVTKEVRRKAGAPCKRKADALFILIGAVAHTDWLPKTLQRDDDGFVCTGRDVSDFSSWPSRRQPYLLETNLPGMFCAGDVRHDSIKRVASGVGEGSMAIAFVHQFLARKGETEFPHSHQQTN